MILWSGVFCERFSSCTRKKKKIGLYSGITPRLHSSLHVSRKSLQSATVFGPAIILRAWVSLSEVFLWLAFFGLNFSINNGWDTEFINSLVFMVHFSGLIRFLHGLSLWKFDGFSHAHDCFDASEGVFDEGCVFIKERGHMGREGQKRPQYASNHWHK